MEPVSIFASMGRLLPSGIVKLFSHYTPGRRISISFDQPRSPVSSYFVPGVRSIGELAVAPGPDMNFPPRGWVRKTRAMPLGFTIFNLTIQARQQTSAILERVSVEVASVEQVPGIALTRAIGGPVEALSLEVDLDAGEVRCRDSRNLADAHYLPIDFNITFAEPLKLRVSNVSTTRAANWRLNLHFLIDGKKVVRKVPEEWCSTIPREYRGIVQTYLGIGGDWTERP